MTTENDDAESEAESEAAKLKHIVKKFYQERDAAKQRMNASNAIELSEIYHREHSVWWQAADYAERVMNGQISE